MKLINNVVCIGKHQINYPVTIGNVYEVLKSDKSYFYIKNDVGKKQKISTKSGNYTIEVKQEKIPKIIKVTETYLIIPSKMNYGK